MPNKETEQLKGELEKLLREHFDLDELKDKWWRMEQIENLIEKALNTQTATLKKKVEGMQGTIHHPVGGLSNIEWVKKSAVLNKLKELK